MKLICPLAHGTALLGCLLTAVANPASAQKPADPNSPLRVLLVADTPTREFRFVRSLFAQQMKQKKMKLSVFLQSPPKKKQNDKDKSQGRILPHFPGTVAFQDKNAPYHSLDEFDLIIAFDFDWRPLTKRQAKLLRSWMYQTGGGVIFLAGPVNTYHLAKKSKQNAMNIIRDMCPVKLADIRFHIKEIQKVKQAGPLAFNVHRGKQLLTLDPKEKTPLEGWNKFFWNDANPQATTGKKPVRGFYGYYPVSSVRSGAAVVATLATNLARINNGRDEQPFIVCQAVGRGEFFYLSSGEFWRLREYSSKFYERFWLFLSGYVSGGRNNIRIARNEIVVEGQPVESESFQLRLRLLPTKIKPVPKSAVAKLYLIGGKPNAPPIMKIPLKPLDNLPGWFEGKCVMNRAGEFRLIVVSGKHAVMSDMFHVRSVFAKVLERQHVVARRYLEIVTQMATLSDRLNKSARRQDKKLAGLYQNLVKEMTGKVLNIRNEKFLQYLRTDNPDLATVQQAVQQSQSLQSEFELLTKRLANLKTPEPRRGKALVEMSRQLSEGQQRQTSYLQKYHKSKLAELLKSLGDLE